MHPRSRSERHVMKFKENLEKERLRNRSGGFHRYENVPNPIDVTKGCPSYINGRDRMTSGIRVAEAMFKEREVLMQERDEKTERRRARSFSREDARWRAIDAMEQAAEDRSDRLRADPMIGRKNVKGQPYDPVHHHYDVTPQGKQLEHHDNMIKYRGHIRQAHLAVRQHLGFNPITGEQSHPIRVPKPPRPHPLAFGDAAPYASYP
eukprot:gnl/MRDRNA2_/MRDRNA2_87222_c0_seq1.p1 gnl/MRDRNA2_/MRDRNA2_87222_c0~~gnl/MRDRNA2_/MRDRNA2_87222_c0_seq1.p1  ORF type:complete len:206 (-),score=29.70 gnl/MRDRNA2_/MRDRNA2_87222_c0_seq1:28-645(-)